MPDPNVGQSVSPLLCPDCGTEGLCRGTLAGCTLYRCPKCAAAWQDPKERKMKTETHEALTAGTLIGQAQEALRRACEMAERGTTNKLRGKTRTAIKRASRAADDAQRAVNAEVADA